MSRITATRANEEYPAWLIVAAVRQHEIPNRTGWYEACSRRARMRAPNSWFIAGPLLEGACGGSNKEAEGPAEQTGREADEKTQEAKDKANEAKDKATEKADEAKEKADEAKDKADDEQ